MSCRFLKVGIMLCLFALVVAGAGQLSSVKAASCPLPHCHHVCPYIVAPVTCADGCTYINGCYASCAGETNCVLSGGL